MNQLKETAYHKLQGKGIRPTMQRVIILDHLIKHQAHLTAEQIYLDISKDFTSLSKATVFNTLNHLVKAGLIRVINLDGIEKRYDVILEDHGHFKCEKCGKIVNFTVDMNKFETQELRGYVIRQKDVVFNGLCPICISQ